MKNAMSRLLNGELGGVKGQPTYVTTILHHSGRGMEAAQVYRLDVSEMAIEPGSFYNVNALPANFIDSQHDFIALAAEHYLSH